MPKDPNIEDVTAEMKTAAQLALAGRARTSNTWPRAWFAVVGREVIQAANDMAEGGVAVGLIPSRSQVNESIGYTGLTTRELMRLVRENSMIVVERDHLGRDMDRDVARYTMEADIRAGVHGVFIDSDDPELYRMAGAAVADGLWIEAGCGESTEDDVTSRFKLARVTNCNVRYVSGPVGTLIRGMSNTDAFDRFAADTYARVTGCPVRVHNCDYVPAHSIAKMHNIGSVNVAPQLGAVMTATFLREAYARSVNLELWCQLVHDASKWRRWTPHVIESVLAGGHYHWEALPKKFREDASPAVVGSAVEFMLLVERAVYRGE